MNPDLAVVVPVLGMCNADTQAPDVARRCARPICDKHTKRPDELISVRVGCQASTSRANSTKRAVMKL